MNNVIIYELSNGVKIAEWCDPDCPAIIYSEIIEDLKNE